MYTMMLGANAIAGTVVAMFFLRFWRVTRDRFFLFFAIAVFIAIGRFGPWAFTN